MLATIVILIIGASGIIAQTILLRELLVSFLGNELTFGIILASWMLAEAIGAFFTAVRLKRLKNHEPAVIWLMVAFSVFLYISVAGARLFKPIFNIQPGQAVGIAMVCVISFVLMFIPAFCHGGLFSVFAAIKCSHGVRIFWKQQAVLLEALF